MSRETVKTVGLIGMALVLSLVAFLYMPKPIQLENQARVNENLFPEYQAADVWTIQLEGPIGNDADLAVSTTGVQQITIQRTNRGWFIEDFENYPAGNNQLIGRIAPVLNNLKVLEVISESPSEQELREYGVLEPSLGNSNPEEAGIRLSLLDATKSPIGELIIGKMARGSGTESYYVRSLLEAGIYRVQISKAELSPFLFNWIDPNLMEIAAPEGLPVVNRGFREVDQLMVSTGKSPIGETDPYRAVFKFEGTPLRKLETLKDGQWITISPDRLPPSSPNLGQPWLDALLGVPAVALMADVKKKSTALAQAFEAGAINENMDLSELQELGFRLDKDGDEVIIAGASGRAVIDARRGMRFQLSFGLPNAAGHVPMILYAQTPTSGLPSAPVREELPEESKDWDEEKRKRELDLIERRFQEARGNYQQVMQQLERDRLTVNQRVAPWIYYIPRGILARFIPSIDLVPAADTSVTPAAEAESGDSPEDNNESVEDDQ